MLAVITKAVDYLTGDDQVMGAAEQTKSEEGLRELVESELAGDATTTVADEPAGISPLLIMSIAMQLSKLFRAFATK